VVDIPKQGTRNIYIYTSQSLHESLPPLCC
jgi:hypothetical protein